MLSAAIAALLVALCLHPLVVALSFSSAGIGVGGAMSDLNAFGLSSSSGDVTAAGSGSAGGPHNGLNMHLSPVGPSLPVDENDDPVPSPDAGSLPLLSTFGLPALVRPQYVPDYRAGAPHAPEAPEKTVVKRKVKKRVEHPVESPQQHPKTCWVVSKKCCYEEVHAGYECKDFYAYKYARCHPVIDYAEKCDAVKEEPADHPKPVGRTKYEETVIKNYDANYGPHVKGYPDTGESEFYETPIIPQKPHNVPGDPHPAPHQYEDGSVTSETNSYATGDAAYDSPKEPSMTSDAGAQTYDATPPTQDTGGVEEGYAEDYETDGEGVDGYGGGPVTDTSSSGGNGYEGAPPAETSASGDNGYDGSSDGDTSESSGEDHGAPPAGETLHNGAGHVGGGDGEGYEDEENSETSTSDGEGYVADLPAEGDSEGYERQSEEETSSSGDNGYQKPESQTSEGGEEEPHVPSPAGEGVNDYVASPVPVAVTSASQSYRRSQ